MLRNKLKHFENKLLEEEKRIKDELSQFEKRSLNNSQSYSTSELSSYDNHPADLGSETFERGKDIAPLENLRILLDKIQQAQDNMRHGKYGICLKCGREINDQRLEAVPWTSECIDCQNIDDGLQSNIRPIEEKVLSVPFSRTYLDDDQSQNGFDGEDAFQAVQRYGTSDTPQDLPGMHDYKQLTTDDSEGGIVDRTDSIPDDFSEMNLRGKREKNNNRA